MGAMAVDHAAVFMIYVNGYGALPIWGEIGLAMRLIGRVAFPLYAFMLVQGFLYTKDRIKYLVRLAALAVVSEIPFNLVASGHVFYPKEQNTVLLLCIGLAVMEGIERLTGSGRRAAAFFTVAAGMLLALVTRADYGAYGLLFILVLYWFRNSPVERNLAGAAVLMLSEGAFYGLAAMIAFFFMNRYNGEKGEDLGRLPYVFYPVHLLIIYAAGVLIL